MKSIRDYKKNGVQFAYYLDCIVDEDYNGNPLTTDEEKIDFLFTCLWEEFVKHDKRRGMTEQDYLADYLRGLPSCINIPFTNYDIADLGKSWGYCSTPRKESDFIYNFFRVSALRLIQIRDYFDR